MSEEHNTQREVYKIQIQVTNMDNVTCWQFNVDLENLS